MKTSIITGGAHGIGKSIALRLLNDGNTVIILDNNQENIKNIDREIKSEHFHIIKCDVGLPDEVQQTLQDIQTQFGKVDYLINNAGISHFSSIDDMTIETWNRIISVNLSSIFYMVKFCKPLFSGNSAIVNIASTRAFMSEPNGEAYGASKGGIVALTHALSASLAPKTRVNCISPGWIAVDENESFSEADHKQHPAGRIGKGSDIAGMAAYLLSDSAGFITGQNFIVDGGMTRKMIYL